jgi:hypothetical protein
VLLPIPPVDKCDVALWWADRVPCVYTPAGVPVLDRWEAELVGAAPPSFPDWTPRGPGRSEYEAAPLITWLRSRAHSAKPITFNALWKEKQGGRCYPYYLRGYEGQLTISAHSYAAEGKKGPKLLLSAIRRDARPYLCVVSPWVQVEGDFSSCHGYIAFGLSGDDQLKADLAAGFHQVTGDWMLTGDAEAPFRRRIGKAVNNAMLFGMESAGLLRLISKFFPGQVPEAWARRAWELWWSRYPRLAAFRDHIQELVRVAQQARVGFDIISPSGRLSRFAPYEVRGEVGKGTRKVAPGLNGAWRTVFSALFRAVEGDLLDQTLRHFHSIREAHGARLILPLYDGLTIAALPEQQDIAERALTICGRQAAQDLGLPDLRLTIKRRKGGDGPTAPA